MRPGQYEALLLSLIVLVLSGLAGFTGAANNTTDIVSGVNVTTANFTSTTMPGVSLLSTTTAARRVIRVSIVIRVITVIRGDSSDQGD